MNRREFCRRFSVTAGALTLAPIISACSKGTSQTTTPIYQEGAQALETLDLPHTPTGSPILRPTQQPTLPTQAATEPAPAATMTPTSEVHTTQVALIRTTDRAAGVTQAMDLLEFNPVSGRPVLLKPNFNSADPAPGSTDNVVLRSLTESLWNMGATSISVCDRSGMGNTRQVIEQKGVYELAEELGFSVTALDELDEEEWVIRHSNDFHWSKGIAVPKILLDSECVVQTCNLKTHQYGGHFTMALKNSVGFVAKTAGNGHDFMQELHGSAYQRQMIAEINAIYNPSLIVLDGVEAFLDGGPAMGKLGKTEIILAGTDPIAIDAVGVAILRLFGTTREVQRRSVFQQDQIARAVELGLGVSQPEQIEFITPDDDSRAYAEQIHEILRA